MGPAPRPPAAVRAPWELSTPPRTRRPAPEWRQTSRRARSLRHDLQTVDVIHGKRGIERHAQQPAFAYGADGECKKGSRQQRSVLDHAQPAILLTNEETAVRR